MRRLYPILLIILAVVPLAACESHHGRSPFETSLPSSVVGLRVTDGTLRVWTGSPCEGTTQVRVQFTAQDENTATLTLNTPTYAPGLTPGVEFEYFTLDGPYPGFTVEQALPSRFDWRTAQRLVFDVAGPPVARGVSGLDFVPVATEIAEHSDEHPENTYFFPDFGWLSPDQVAARNGTEFLTVCTPDPAKDEEVTAAVGVRVTDDSLRFWTGSPCPFNAGAIVTFQPGQAETILQKNEHPASDFEYLTVGTPDPKFTVTHPLPEGFDWRTATTVLFRLAEKDPTLDRYNILWSRTTDLSAPLAESSRHSPDTYYFEGIGWLNPTQVGQEGALDTICGA